MMHAFLELLVPRGCLLCGLPMDDSSENPGICNDCDATLPRPRGTLCAVCGKPLISEKEKCLRCRETAYYFKENRSAFLYIETGRRLVAQYKFFQERHLSTFIKQAIGETSILMERPDYLVPVPPDMAKLRKRGWDPVRVLTQSIADQGIPILDALERKKGKEQKSLDLAGRMANIHGRFSLSRPIPENKVILLVDDVFTTGATMSECARVLSEHGAGRVNSLTLAIDP